MVEGRIMQEPKARAFLLKTVTILPSALTSPVMSSGIYIYFTTDLRQP